MAERDEQESGAQIVVHSDGHTARRDLVRVTLDLLLPEDFTGNPLDHVHCLSGIDVIQSSAVPARIVMM